MGGINHQKWVVYYCNTHITKFLVRGNVRGMYWGITTITLWPQTRGQKMKSWEDREPTMWCFCSFHHTEIRLISSMGKFSSRGTHFSRLPLGGDFSTEVPCHFCTEVTSHSSMVESVIVSYHNSWLRLVKICPDCSALKWIFLGCWIQIVWKIGSPPWPLQHLECGYHGG